jgi:hypothetical protein
MNLYFRLLRALLRFRLDACDKRWNSMRSEFLHGGQVCAAGCMKGAAVARTGLVGNSESCAARGQPLFTPALPEPVRHRLDAERGLMQAAW